MANLIIQEKGVARTRPAVTGEEITIKTPCGCSDVTGVQINGVVFPFYDATGHSLADTDGLFTQDSLIRVMVDADKMRAYILNADTNAYLESRFDEKATLTDGVFATQVSANSSGQAHDISLLRNSRLVSEDTDPTVNGEINWTYG